MSPSYLHVDTEAQTVKIFSALVISTAVGLTSLFKVTLDLRRCPLVSSRKNSYVLYFKGKHSKL